MAVEDPNIAVVVGGDVTSLGAAMTKGAGHVKGFDRQSSTSLKSVAKKLAGVATAAISLTGAVAGLRKVTEVTRQFEVLNSQLKTATGSSKNATAAFQAIQQIAATTPYDLQQVTEGFTKLVNLGLTPSQRALMSYGDTASAMGKDLNQLIEAVADAATGEFERLKEFGIKAKTQGDNVALTFRGTTTVVKKNAAEIEEYLMRLGEVNFAGAMADRMDTLDGAISNLGDTWDQLLLSVSKAGIGDAVESGVRLAIEVLDELNAWFASGQLAAYIEAIGGKFRGFVDDVTTSVEFIREYFAHEFDVIGQVGGETVGFLINAFKNLPENLRAFIQLMAVEIGALVDYGREYGRAFAEVLGIQFAKLVEKAKVYGREIANAVNPFRKSSGVDIEAEMRRLDGIAAEMADEAISRAMRNAEVIAQARRDSIVPILQERDVALASFDAQTAAAEQLRAKYEETIAARQAQFAANDPLAGFGKGAAGGEQEDTKAAEKQARELEALKERYLTEQELLAQHRETMALIGEEWDISRFETEEQWRQVRLQAEQEFYGKLGDLANKGYSGVQSIISAKWGAIGAETAGAMKSIIGTMATGSRKAFEVSKAWALADATISMFQGIAAGVRLGWPMAIPAVAWAAATGIAQISQIRAQKFGGPGGAAAAGAGAPATAPNPVGVGGSTGGSNGDGGGEGPLVTFRGIDPSKMYDGRHIIAQINEAIANGARLRVAS